MVALWIVPPQGAETQSTATETQGRNTGQDKVHGEAFAPGASAQQMV